MTVERFGGVDFSTHATKADLTHSPDACNMMAGETDFLVKRPGYKKMAQAEGKVYGLFALPGETGAIVHAGETLFHMSAGGTLTQLCTGMSPAYSFAFRMNGALYLLDGQTYRKVFKQDGSWTVQAVSEAAFVPTTTIAAPPTGGGASLEAGQSADPETHQHLCRQWVGHTVLSGRAGHRRGGGHGHCGRRGRGCVIGQPLDRRGDTGQRPAECKRAGECGCYVLQNGGRQCG